MRGAGLGLRARARMCCVRLHACMCRPACSPCTYARMQSCMLLAARMCVLGGVHTCMSKCTVTACTCAWGCGLAVHGTCVCACECVGSRACTPPTRTHMRGPQAGRQEGWTFLQFKGCENVMVSMATPGQPGAGRALRAPSRCHCPPCPPRPPRLPPPLAGGPSPFWGRPIGNLNFPRGRGSPFAHQNKCAPVSPAPPPPPPGLESHSASPCGR